MTTITAAKENLQLLKAIYFREIPVQVNEFVAEMYDHCDSDFPPSIQSVMNNSESEYVRTLCLIRYALDTDDVYHYGASVANEIKAYFEKFPDADWADYIEDHTDGWGGNLYIAEDSEFTKIFQQDFFKWLHYRHFFFCDITKYEKTQHGDWDSFIVEPKLKHVNRVTFYNAPARKVW